jgi:ADP-dependent NAD(P)H-hydrate dehydratase / NAD(P)H-hydrate epimerase
VRLVTPAGAAAALRERLVEIVVVESGPGDVLSQQPQLDAALDDGRLGAVVVGPGLGRAAETAAAVRSLVLREGPPLVVDADALWAFAGDAQALRGREGLVLTPHAGELAQLLGVDSREVTASALTAARRGAEATGQVVVLKGSSTVIAAPDGRVCVVVQGPPQLASAGTGDVLAGCVGTFLAKGLPPFEAAAAACWVHAEAGRVWASGRNEGLVAADLIELLPDIVSAHVIERRPGWTI